MNRQDSEDGSITVEGSVSEMPLPASAIFNKAHHFEVSGGTWTNVTNITHTPRSDFRRIPFGDIDLHRVLESDGGGVLYRPPERGCVRRLYSARIGMQKAPMTAALYMGEDAKEEWVRQISKYSLLRHPNLMQIYCTASANHVYAAIFHGELIRSDDFVKAHHHSPLFAMYILHCANELYCDMSDALFSGGYVSSMTWSRTDSIWLRSTSGRICLDFQVGFTRPQEHFTFRHTLPENTVCFFEPQPESTILAALPINGVELFWRWLATHHFLAYSFSPLELDSTESIVNVTEGVIDTTLPGPPFVKVAELSSYDQCVWTRWDNSLAHGTLLTNGWVRFANFKNGNIVVLYMCLELSRQHGDIVTSWIAQANHIFKSLEITAHHENYVLVDDVRICLLVEETRERPPEAFCWPACPAYWSLDETGEERLSEEDALRLGFPAISYKTEIHGLSWGSDTYAMVSKLHRSKGFNPESQDVARHLNEPLYQLPDSDELVSAPPAFAHIFDETSAEYERQTSVVGEENIEADDDSGVFDPSESTLAGPTHIKNLGFYYEESPVLPGDHEWLGILKSSLIFLNVLLAILY